MHKLCKQKTTRTGCFLFELQNVAEIAVDDRRIESDDLVGQHSFRNGVIKKYLFVETERVVHFQKSSSAYVIADAIFIEVKDENGIIVFDDVGAMLEHGSFPFCVCCASHCPDFIFHGWVVETVRQGNGMSTCLQCLLYGGNCSVKVLAANKEYFHGVVATGFEPVTPAM